MKRRNFLAGMFVGTGGLLVSIPAISEHETIPYGPDSGTTKSDIYLPWYLAIYFADGERELCRLEKSMVSFDWSRNVSVDGETPCIGVIETNGHVEFKIANRCTIEFGGIVSLEGKLLRRFRRFSQGAIHCLPGDVFHLHVRLDVA